MMSYQQEIVEGYFFGTPCMCEFSDVSKVAVHVYDTCIMKNTSYTQWPLKWCVYVCVFNIPWHTNLFQCPPLY